MTASFFSRKYAPAINSAKEVLKCLDGPANTVRPGDIPPSIEPDKATLTIGTSVAISFFILKNLDSERISVALSLELFLSLSIMDAMYISFDY